MKFVYVPIGDDVARIEVPNNIKYVSYRKAEFKGGKGPRSGRIGLSHWFTDRHNVTWHFVQWTSRESALREKRNGFEIARVDGTKIP